MSTVNSTFNFKEFDAEGLETLKVISEAFRFNRWTYDTIKPFCSGKIIEIGSGIGNVSEQFINDKADITLSDIRKNYREFLKARFPEHSSKSRIIPIDLVHPQFNQIYESHLEKYDTVFSLNVIEHIENDILAVGNCKKLVKPGGTLITLMPAFQWLYNSFDKELFHYRRYNKKTIKKLFYENQLTVANAFYFNSGGVPGWYISGNRMHNKIIPASQMKLFDSLVPVFKILDKLLMNSIGLSVVCVGKKGNEL